MAEYRTVQSCRWAEPTLFLDELIWTEAERFPWSCLADGDPELVQDTERCATCGRWVPRTAAPEKRCPAFRPATDVGPATGES